MPKRVINNRFRVEYIGRQLDAHLKDEYLERPYKQSLINNLAMLIFMRKRIFSYIEFLKNIHSRQEYDENLDNEGSPLSFVHECVTQAAILQTCTIIGRKNGLDFGSILRFASKEWSPDVKWRQRLHPNQKHLKKYDRILELRSKLIAHSDLDLTQVITERDIKNLIQLFDLFVVKRVDAILTKFLGHNFRGSFDFEDMSVQTYALLYPRGAS